MPDAVKKSDVRFSVVVPVYNSSRDLEQCLDALSRSTFDSFDVLVVDDGSTESIEPIVVRYGFDYMRIDGPSGPARARNRGVETVRGDTVIFVDADVTVHEDTIACFAKAFECDSSIAAVIGTYDDEPAHPGFVSQYKNVFHHYVHQSAHGDIGSFWSGCGAMRRSIFTQFGGFDEKRYARPAIEDIELGTWLAAAGHRIVLDSDIKCKHLKRWTLGNLLKTDVFDRAIPWTRLMLRAGVTDKTLNVKTSQRISVVLVYLCLLFLGLGVWRPWALAGAATGFAIVTVVNWDFYQYFFKRRGIWFTLRVVPMHWLYFLYCGFGAGVGTLQHVLSNEKRAGAPATVTGRR